MKAHKYWSLGALVSIIGTFYTGYKGVREAHKYFAFGSLICMIMAIYSGHKLIAGNKKTIKHTDFLHLLFRPLPAFPSDMALLRP
jgi:amino acid transporter